MLVARSLGLVAPLAVALCVVTAGDARASGPVSLRWSAPADCPAGDDVLEEVNRLLGARASSQDGVLDVVAEVKRKDDGTYVVRLEIPSADGPRLREVSAVSCVALGQATALILAMMVDPEAALAAPPAPDLPGPTPPGQTDPKPVDAGPKQALPKPAETPLPPLPVPSPSVVPPVVTAPRPRLPEKKAPVVMRRPVLSGSGQFLGDLGSLPGPAFGVGGTFGVFPGRWRFEVGGAYFLEKSKTFPSLKNEGSNINLAAFHLAAGYAFVSYPKLEFAPHIRFDFGGFDAASFGVSTVDKKTAAFAGIGADVVLSYRLYKYFWARFGLEGVKLLSYPRFIVTGVGVAHEPSSIIVGRISLGGEVRF